MFVPESPRSPPQRPHSARPVESDQKALLGPVPDIQSMLMDGEVSDAQLAEALVRLHAEEIYWLVSALQSTANPPQFDREASLKIVLDVLSQVVVHRERQWAHLSLRAWLARLGIEEYRKQERGARLQQRLTGGFAPAEKAGGKRPETPLPIQKAWQKMVRREQISLLLREGLGLSIEEIASILDLELYPVEYWLRESRLKIAASQPRQPGPGLPPASRTSGSESSLGPALRAFLPEAQLSQAKMEVLSARIGGRVQAARSRRRAAIAVREFFMLSFVLGVLFFSCRAAGLIPEELIHRYGTQTPTPVATATTPAPQPTPAAAFYYDYYAQPGETLGEIARRARVSQADIMALNPFNHWPGRGFMLDPGAALRMPASKAMDWRVTPTPVRPAVSPPPLTARSEIPTILQRIQDHPRYWRTIWMNIQEDVYGPPGYLGPPLQQVLWQIWASPPARAKAIIKFSGASEESLFSKSIYTDGILLRLNSANGELQGQFQESEGGDFFMPLQAFPEPWFRVSVLREDSVADRAAIVLEVQALEGLDPDHIWVDASTGVILRRTTFSAQAPGVVVREMKVTAIAYDQDFPAAVFNPGELRSTGFSAGSHGQPLPDGQDIPIQAPDPANGHARRPSLPLPEGLDPSLQPVFLQWPEGWVFDTRIPKEGGPSFPLNQSVSVFASRYLLGDLPLENMSFHNCRRSPDGRLIALSAGSRQAGYSSSRLYWFALENPGDLHSVSELGYWRNLYAFSPDSRSLAFISCDGMGVCSLQSLDFDSGALAQIDSRGYFPQALAWSPDGRFLILVVEAYSATSSLAIEVVDAGSGEEIYFGPYNAQTGAVPPDAPTLRWDLSIPLIGNQDQGCMQP